MNLAKFLAESFRHRGAVAQNCRFADQAVALGFAFCLAHNVKGPVQGSIKVEKKWLRNGHSSLESRL